MTAATSDREALLNETGCSAKLHTTLLGARLILDYSGASTAPQLIPILPRVSGPAGFHPKHLLPETVQTGQNLVVSYSNSLAQLQRYKSGNGSGLC